MAITRPQFWRSPVRSTFHGRDIFAPVAAHLSLGVPLKDFGETITSFTILHLQRPYRESDGTLIGHVLNVDNFGNLFTSFKSSDLPRKSEVITFEIGDCLIHGLRRTYGEAEGLIALIGSSGHMEISLKEGNANILLQVKVGDEVKIRID